MRTYRDVSRDIAEDVAAGKLASGSALASVRTAALRYDTTAATVARAYRSLADAGVIATADRRRARVAADGAAAAIRLLGAASSPSGPPVLHLAGSDDPGLDIAVRAAGSSVVTTGPRGSFHGLTLLWKGTADAAAIHLRHHSGGYNAPFAEALLRGRRPAVIHVWRREQGILTAAGSPAGLGALAWDRFARRPFGTGTRVLLDRLLAEAEIPASRVGGPDAATHLEVAMAVCAGQATAGLAVRAAATALGLAFSPVIWEEFDIVLPAAALPAAERLIAALRDPGVQGSVSALGGYDLSRTGTVQLLA
jgi:putative molybdopterin biosynthesis protein